MNVVSTIRNNLLPLLLVTVVFFSKNIIIMNEEILVAISFVGFIFFSYRNLHESVVEAHELRAQEIRKEISSFHLLWEKYLQELVDEHKKLHEYSTTVHEAMATLLGQFSSKEMVYVADSYQSSFSNVWKTQIHQKLETLCQLQGNTEEKVRLGISLGFKHAILDHVKRSRKELQSKLIRQAHKAVTA